MSASAAMAKKKSREMIGSKSNSNTSNTPSFGEVEETPKEISPNQLLVQHDYKLHIFENKIKELHERCTLLSKNQQTSIGGLTTVNENMLTEALQAMDERLDNLEENYSQINKNNINEEHKGLIGRIEKIETDQNDLKALLLKIQGLTMETQMRMMQLRGSETSISTTTSSPTTCVNSNSSDNNIEEQIIHTSLESIQEESIPENVKKSKKNKQ